MEVLHEHATPDVSSWFSHGVNRCMDGGGSLEKCLGLSTKNGGAHFAKRHFLQLRDQACREVLSSCDGKHQKQRIENAHEHIEQFEKRFWPGHKHLSEPPKQWSNLRKQLFFYFMYAKKSGSRTSLSDRQYYEIAGPVGRSKKKEQLTITERINHQVIKNAAT